MWRAIRYGLSGGLFDLGALEVRPARAELERVGGVDRPRGGRARPPARRFPGRTPPSGRSHASRKAGRSRRPMRSRSRSRRPTLARAELGIFGGIGLLLVPGAGRDVELETPYGKPSAPIAIGDVGGARVAFLPRHGPSTSCRRTGSPTAPTSGRCASSACGGSSGPCASGALQPDLALGAFVVCDQFVDRTWGRADTFYDGPRDDARLGGRPVLPRAAAAPRRDRARARHPGRGRRHGRRHPGAALLDPGRVALVPADRAGT